MWWWRTKANVSIAALARAFLKSSQIFLKYFASPRVPLRRSSQNTPRAKISNVAAQIAPARFAKIAKCLFAPRVKPIKHGTTAKAPWTRRSHYRSFKKRAWRSNVPRSKKTTNSSTILSLSFFLSSQIKLKSIVNRSTLFIFIPIEEIQSQNEWSHLSIEATVADSWPYSFAILLVHDAHPHQFPCSVVQHLQKSATVLQLEEWSQLGKSNAGKELLQIVVSPITHRAWAVKGSRRKRTTAINRFEL